MFNRFKNKLTSVFTGEEQLLSYQFGKDNPQQLFAKMNRYFLSNPVQKNKYARELSFISDTVSHMSPDRQLLYSVLPYPFVMDFDTDAVSVHRDYFSGMCYVYLDGKRLYYHDGFASYDDIRKSFTYISAEQHKQSPHRYLLDDFFVEEGDTVVDFGAAEGNFSLSVVEKAKKLIIVESDERWIKALYKTFTPWSDKVTIVNKLIGTEDAADTITFSSLFRDGLPDVIKMDIEGMEYDVLQSAATILGQQSRCRLAVTTYHRHSDAGNIERLLGELGFSLRFSEGYMLFVYDQLSPPYFRKGLIRANK